MADRGLHRCRARTDAPSHGSLESDRLTAPRWISTGPEGAKDKSSGEKWRWSSRRVDSCLEAEMKEHFAPRAEWTKEGGEARPRGRRCLVRGSKTDRSRWASVGRWAG